MVHAKKVMDRQELETIQKLHDEFKEAIDGTIGKTIPEDERAGSANKPRGMRNFATALRSKLVKQLTGGTSKSLGKNSKEPLQIVEENEGD